jgi:hypothetical protein
MLREQFQMVCQNDSEGYVVEALRHSNLFIVSGIPSFNTTVNLHTFCHVCFHVAGHNGVDADFVARILGS